jgi:hypothetical protein
VAKHLISDVNIVASCVTDLWREHLSSLTIYPLLSLQRTSLRWCPVDPQHRVDVEYIANLMCGFLIEELREL